MKNICLDTEGAQIRTTYVDREIFYKKNVKLRVYCDTKKSNKKEVYLNWNFGPQGKSNLNTLHIIKLASKAMNKKYEIVKNSKVSLKESKYLNLDSSRSKRLLNWNPLYDINKSIKETVQWYEIYFKNSKKINEHTLKIINDYLKFV